MFKIKTDLKYRLERIAKALPNPPPMSLLQRSYEESYVPESSDVTEQSWAISVLNPHLSIPKRTSKWF